MHRLSESRKEKKISSNELQRKLNFCSILELEQKVKPQEFADIEKCYLILYTTYGDRTLGIILIVKEQETLC